MSIRRCEFVEEHARVCEKMTGVHGDDVCLDPDDVAALLLARLDPASLHALEQHVAVCSECRELLSALAQSEAPLALATSNASGEPGDDVAFASTLPWSESQPDLAPGTRVGRYVVESRLGAGAMGAVYAAHDPELDRRIALKILRHDGFVGAERELVRDRLRREAQAMAQLAHPNVVTVYDVGTVNDHIFIAMELVDGQTLASWLAAAPRSWRAVAAMFLSAGRGLAAAHTTGMVHRDFKPENVLVGNDGRVRVGDFGLARMRTPKTPNSSDGHAGSDWANGSGSTTGLLVGTPYYMAPEQFLCRTTDARTDEFSFCVALYAAIARQHPFSGDDVEGLAEAVAAGRLRRPPDRSILPRGLLRILRRGLATDPADRYPSMDALLTELSHEHAKRRRGVGISPGGLVATAVLLISIRDQNISSDSCEPPARDTETVWSPAIAAGVGQKVSDAHVKVLAAVYRDWQAARAKACVAPPQVKVEQLQCLDGVIERFYTLRLASVHVAPEAAEALQAQFADPEICSKPTPADVPRLTLAPTPDVVAAYVLLGRSETEHKPSDTEFTALIDATMDPCARVVATLAFNATSKDLVRTRSLMVAAVGAADRCGDERLRADLRIQDIPYHWEWPIAGPNGDAAVAQAQNAAARVMQPEVAAALAGPRRSIARQRKQWDEAFRQTEVEFTGYRARGLQIQQVRAVIARNDLRLLRSEPSDLEAVLADAERWRSTATAKYRSDLAAVLDKQAAEARFWLGDVEAGAAALLHLWRKHPRTEGPTATREIRGQVIDVHGRPVAGTTVAVANLLNATSFAIGFPLLNFEGGLHFATTDSGGHFVVTGPIRTGAIVAQLADRRSKPAAIADHVRLVLAPTRRVSGKVNLQGIPYTQIYVYCTDVDDPTRRFGIIAPVAADGSFIMDGATTGAVRVGVVVKTDDGISGHTEFQTRPASSAPVTDLRFTLLSSTRTLNVVIRSAIAAGLEGAQVIVLPGTHRLRYFGDLSRRRTSTRLDQYAIPINGVEAPNSMLDEIRPGDFMAHLEHVAPGEITVCALGFTGDMSDPQVQKRLQDHVMELRIRCEQLGPNADSVVIAAPPQQRFD